MIGGLGPVPIDADEIVRVDRGFGLGPKVLLKDGRTVITTAEALAHLERMKPGIVDLMCKPGPGRTLS
jgi:hypothetical protein